MRPILTDQDVHARTGLRELPCRPEGLHVGLSEPESGIARDAIISGAKTRFRPIMLTSLTTFLGVAPLVFERSLQAQFLIPMAASLAFGIVFATAILMLLVPALAMVQANVEAWWVGRRARQLPTSAAQLSATGD